ncbi:hypothetical protein KEM55_006936, partial [Ascosphaera atra]
LWAEVEELLDLQERYMDLSVTKEEKEDVAKEMKTKAVDLARDTAELTKWKYAQLQATQQETRAPTTMKEPKEAKGHNPQDKERAQVLLHCRQKVSEATSAAFWMLQPFLPSR